MTEPYWFIADIEEGPSTGLRVTFENRHSGRTLTGVFTRWETREPISGKTDAELGHFLHLGSSA